MAALIFWMAGWCVRVIARGRVQVKAVHGVCLCCAKALVECVECRAQRFLHANKDISFKVVRPARQHSCVW